MIEKNLTQDERWMQAALREAEKAAKKNEVPIGAVAVYKGKIIARAHNIRQKTQDPLGHAELLLLRKAAKKLESWRMPDLEVYVTLEPCLMCLGGLHQARVKKIVFAATDPSAGACRSVWNFEKDSRFRKILIIGEVFREDSRRLLQKFFKKLR